MSSNTALYSLLVLPLLLGLGVALGPSPDVVPSAADHSSFAPTADASNAFSDGRAGFSVRVRDEVIPYEVMALFVMPGEQVRLEATTQRTDASFVTKAQAGTVTPSEPNVWHWTAPRTPGLHPLTITDVMSGERIQLNAFVLTPHNHKKQRLNGYRIGHYEQTPLRGDPIYNRPQGFVRLTPENRDVLVSPHFTLGQFACKQTDAYPQYLIVRKRLLLKLELILQKANARGYAAQTLHVMSGFRTPYYNRSIGNRTTYSRHVYGGAADVFIDNNNDGRMDDLNGDGRITEADARVLADVVEDQRGEQWYRPFLGGLGIYGPAPHRGPFIHVDARGYPARW
jgi:hypothetical protein